MVRTVLVTMAMKRKAADLDRSAMRFPRSVGSPGTRKALRLIAPSCRCQARRALPRKSPGGLIKPTDDVTSCVQTAHTIDGRLVGDIGEVIAALEFDVVLDDRQPDHDAKGLARKGIGQDLLSFPISELRRLSEVVSQLFGRPRRRRQ